MKVKMVIIELYMYKRRAIHMIKWGHEDFLNRKRLSYFILQDNPDVLSHHKYLIK